MQKCVHLPALEPLLHAAPPNILKHVVAQFSKVLPNDAKARRLFVTSRGLEKIQQIKAEPGTDLREYIDTINNCYPEEIVRYEKTRNKGDTCYLVSKVLFSRLQGEAPRENRIGETDLVLARAMYKLCACVLK